MCAVGDDFAGSGYDRWLEELKIQRNFFIVPGNHKPTAFMFTDESGDQITFFEWGASEVFRLSEPPALPFVHMATADPLFNVRVAERAGFSSFDPGQDLHRYHADQLSAILSRISLLFANQHEVEGMCRILGIDKKALIERVQMAVFTQGAKGSTLHFEGGEDHIPAIPVWMAEPTGAGDAYRAGFLTAYVRGYPHCQLGEQQFHPTTLVHFRQRLLEQDLSAVAFEAVLEALAQSVLIKRQSRQRLDSTQMLGRVSRMSRLDCVLETLRMSLKEIGEKLPPARQPHWWSILWDRYVNSQTDYSASLETLARKLVEAGQDAHRLLKWVAQETGSKWAQGKQVQLLGRVFGEQFEVTGPSAPQPKAKEQLGSERVQNPHDPEATYASKGNGEQRKEHVGPHRPPPGLGDLFGLLGRSDAKCIKVDLGFELPKLQAGLYYLGKTS